MREDTKRSWFVALSMLAALVTVNGCARSLRASATQPNPLRQPRETLRLSEPVVIVTGDKDLTVPDPGAVGGNQRVPLKNAARFAVVSRDRLRFHVRIEHKWSEWADLASWDSFIEVDRHKRFVPEDVDVVRNKHVVTMWDQTLQSVRRNRYRDIVHVSNDAHVRRVGLGSVSRFRCDGSLTFYARDIFTPDVDSLTLVLVRGGVEMRFSWRFSDEPEPEGLALRVATQDAPKSR